MATMNGLGYIEVKLQDLHPDEFDISNLVELLKNVENLLYPNDKKKRPVISYEVKEGSVRNIFKTMIGQIIMVNATLAQVNNTKSIDYIDSTQAKAIEGIQEWATKNNKNLIINTSVENSTRLEINRNTKYQRSENIWIDSDLYLYGKVLSMGGKTNPNLHISTEEYGTVIIQTTETVLANQSDNRLYKYAGVHVHAKQNIKSGELDKSEIKLLSFVEYEQILDDEYLDDLIEEASKSWSDVKDTDKWLAEIRGLI